MLTGGKDQLAWTFFDSGSAGAAGVNLTLFTVPRGSGTTPKTLYDTNMTESGKIAGWSEFVIRAMSIMGEPGLTPANIVSLSKGSFVLEIGNKPYVELPIFSISAASGLHINSGASSLGTNENGQFGEPHQKALYTLPQPIAIPENYSFNLKLVWPSAPGDLKFWFFLHGELSRPIQ